LFCFVLFEKRSQLLNTPPLPSTHRTLIPQCAYQSLSLSQEIFQNIQFPLSLSLSLSHTHTHTLSLSHTHTLSLTLSITLRESPISFSDLWFFRSSPILGLSSELSRCDFKRISSSPAARRLNLSVERSKRTQKNEREKKKGKEGGAAKRTDRKDSSGGETILSLSLFLSLKDDAGGGAHPAAARATQAPQVSDATNQKKQKKGGKKRAINGHSFDRLVLLFSAIITDIE
jgi:hypothetical protein